MSRATDYSQKGHYYIEQPRFELRHLMPLLPKRAHILDMGAGNGNNTVALLSHGHTVTAVEPNLDMIPILQSLQREYPKQLHIVTGSLDTFAPQQTFDAVICCMVVHFMDNHDAGVAAVRRIQSWTKPGGFNLLTGYMDTQRLSEEYSFLLGPRELAKLYEGWKIRWSQESFRLTVSRIRSMADIPRLLLGKRGYKAARIVAQKL